MGGLTLGMLAMIGAALLALVVPAYLAARAYTHPPRTRPTRTPAILGLAYETTQLRCSDGVVVPAWHIPGRNGAAVILVHGLGANRDFMLDRAARLAERGFGALLLDLRAHGESVGGSCSIGWREVAEVRAAVAYLASLGAAAPRTVGIFGESLGGSVALLASAQVPQLRAVVVDSAFSALEDVLKERFESFVHLPRWSRPLVQALGQWQAGVRVRQVRPVDAAGRLAPRPLLVIHGGLDELFPPYHAERLYQAAGEPRALWLVPEAGHAAIFGLRPQEYVERLADFFSRSLLQPDPALGHAPGGPGLVLGS